MWIKSSKKAKEIQISNYQRVKIHNLKVLFLHLKALLDINPLKNLPKKDQ